MSFRRDLRSLNKNKEEITLDEDLTRIADSVLSEVKEKFVQFASAGMIGTLLTIVEVEIVNEVPDFYPYDSSASENETHETQCGTVRLRTNRELKDIYEYLHKEASEDGIMVELVSASLLKERYSLRFSISA